MTDEAEAPSFWQNNADAFRLNGLVAGLAGLCALLMYFGLMDGLISLIAIFITLAIGALGNFIVLVFKLVTGRYSQAVAYMLGLLVISSLFYALWVGVSSSPFGKSPGG